MVGWGGWGQWGALGLQSTQLYAGPVCCQWTIVVGAEKHSFENSKPSDVIQLNNDVEQSFDI